MSSEGARLVEVAGGVEFAWLWRRLRSRLERGEPLDGTLRHPNPSAEERAALSRLLGRSLQGATLNVPLAALESMLRDAGLACDLRVAVETLGGGPVEDLRARRRSHEDAWRELFVEVRASSGLGDVGESWLSELETTGLLKRLAGGDVIAARKLLESSVLLARRLPGKGASLAELAAEVCRDSHALDAGRPLGTLAVRLAAGIGRVEQVASTQGYRDAWASVGVLCDELSAPVLVLNVRAAMDNITGRLMKLHSDAGEPQRLSIRQLLRDPPKLHHEHLRTGVFVCENPMVLAAAANALGARSAPLICTEGQPKTATRILLNALREAGVELHFHVDFDWAGITIGNLLVARHGAVPWRMGQADFEQEEGEVVLSAGRVEASWEVTLANAMEQRGKAIFEEQVMASLLGDLGRGRSSP